METVSGIGIDIGTRHLAIAFAKLTGMPPPFDPMWIHEASSHDIDHVPDDYIPFLQVDYLASIDLKGLSTDDDAIPNAQRNQSEVFMSDELIKYTNLIEDKIIITQEPTVHAAINSADETASKRQGRQLIVPRSGFYESVFSEFTDHEMVVESLSYKFQQPEFRWMFKRDYPIFIEPQMDQIGDRFKAIMWALSLTIRGVVRSLDSKHGILDENGEPCRIITYSKKKYGLEEAIDAIYGRDEYNSKSDKQQYTIRKQTVVVVVDAILWKTGNVKARKFLRGITKKDDPADALAIFLAAIMTNFKMAGVNESTLVNSFGSVSNDVGVVNLKEKLAKFQKKFNGRQKKEPKQKGPKRPPVPKGMPPAAKPKQTPKKKKEQPGEKKAVQKKLNFKKGQKKKNNYDDNDDYDIKEYQAYDGFDDADELANILEESTTKKNGHKEKVKDATMNADVYAVYVTTMEDYDL